MKEYSKLSLKLHKKLKGKLEVISKARINTKQSLSTMYTPGVAEPCRKINQNKNRVYEYTIKGNTVAVVTDGTAVLGLGDIGPEAALPVMEGKAALFKEFSGIDAFPICLATKNVEEIIETVKRISPGFGGINLEDISAPRCFEIEDRLKKELDIPVFHDDQHGTAIVVLAGLVNSLKIVKKNLSKVKIVLLGAGAAGISVTRLLIKKGAENIIVVDSAGSIYSGRKANMNVIKEDLAIITNKKQERGNLIDVIKNADVFIGVSGPRVLTPEMVKTMSSKPIIFALANPIPEIMPDDAKRAGAFIVATGRSDFPNQINNVLAFPGVFKGALSVRSRIINEEMKLAAAQSLADMVLNPNPDKIIPDPFTPNLADKVADAVKKAAKKSKVNRI